LESSPLPLARFDFGTMLLTDANDAAREVLGAPNANVFPLPLKKIIEPADEELAERSLKLVADGTLHAYDAPPRVRRLDRGGVPCPVGRRAPGPPNDPSALVLFLPESPKAAADETPAPPGTRLSLTGPVAVGSIDAATRIKQISADAKALLKTKPEDLLEVA